MPRIAVVGVGNCCAALLQALSGLRQSAFTHAEIVGDSSMVDPTKIEIVAAFDVDRRKVGRPLTEAITAPPNCTTTYFVPAPSDVIVTCGRALDGVEGPVEVLVDVDPRSATIELEDVAVALSESATELVLIYLPVGSAKAADFYAGSALEAGCGVVNCTPAPLANDMNWRRRFAEAGLPLVGDDMKSHIGSTTVHQALLELLGARGIAVDSTYQLNVGGNSDFLNMRDAGRAQHKRTTKKAALSQVLGEAVDQIGVGPSDYIPHLADHKVGYIRIEGTGYMGMPFSMEVRLEVEDSPNAAAVAIEAIRVAHALRTGAAIGDSAYRALFKAPPPPHLGVPDERAEPDDQDNATVTP